MVHFNNINNNLADNKISATDENGNKKEKHSTDAKDQKQQHQQNKKEVKDSVSINFSPQVFTSATQQPYNSTPLQHDGNNKLHQNFRSHSHAYYLNANKLERTSPIQRSISNVSNAMPLCKLSKGKACRLFNECDLGCDDHDLEHENNFREFNKTVRYPMRILIDGPYGTPSSDIFQVNILNFLAFFHLLLF